MSMSVYCLPQRRQYWKQFSIYLGESQTISGRTYQNAWGIINNSERNLYHTFRMMNYTNSSFMHCVHIFMCMCFYIPACVLLNCDCMQCVIITHYITSCMAVQSMQSINRLHHVPPLNYATCSSQGYSHNHKTTTAQTVVRPNHYLAVRAKPCQGEAWTSCFLVTF